MLLQFVVMEVNNMKKPNIWAIGFMLFAMFFGAGNLIFPPSLGYNAGEQFWLSMTGFIFTGVGLPLLTIAVGSMAEGGYSNAFKKINPIFSVVLMILINLSIGPFFAIPRTAATAFDMGVIPFINNENSKLALLIFSAIFFIISLALSLKPSKLSDTIGKILTPIMLITILALIVSMFVHFSGNHINQPQSAYITSNPLLLGFEEGYLTMDAIGAVTFSIIVINSIRQEVNLDNKGIFSYSLKAGLISAILLAIIYTCLGWAGAYTQPDTILIEGQHTGTYILHFVASKTFGNFGIPLLAIIVGLACLTTSIGLISAVSEYFHELIPKISYKVWAFIFTIMSFIFANRGLNQVIETSKPVLGIIYPIVMTSVLLILISKYIRSNKLSIQLPVFLVTLMSIISLLSHKGIIDIALIRNLPLYNHSLEWLIFAFIGYIIGRLLGNKDDIICFECKD